MVLEVCADSVASAVAAERGGAHRIELCANLVEGGVTPSPGLLATVRSRLSVGVYVMIRPRGGDFLYSPEELEVMERDIQEARRLGADGFVLGMLNEDGCVDVEGTRRLVQRAHPLPVTFHRAIDMTPDPLAALEDVIATGARRILSSGGASNGIEGCAVLEQLQAASSHRIAIMAGGGLNPGNVKYLAEASGIEEFHASLRKVLPSSSRFRKRGIAMGEAADGEYLRYATPVEDVRAMVEALGAVARESPIGRDL